MTLFVYLLIAIFFACLIEDSNRQHEQFIQEMNEVFDQLEARR